jgi:recombinational DNA repair protein (RecF pathway)
MLKLIDLGTVEGQHNPELFDLLLEFLVKLKKEERVRRLAKEFEREFVRLEGILREDLDPHYILSEHVGKDLSRW